MTEIENNENQDLIPEENHLSENDMEVQNTENVTSEEPVVAEEPVAEGPADNTPMEDTETVVEDIPSEEKTSKKKTWTLVAIIVGAIALIGIIIGILFATGVLGKYKGFKKDRQTGIYYHFYGDIHDTADMPKTGDLVGILFSLRAGDSLLIPMMPNEMLMDSVYEGDIYAAIRMMHVGDSATFIFNGADFFKNLMNGQEYPFGDDPLYMDVKLYGRMAHEQFVKMQAEYEQMLKDKQVKESSDIEEYVKKNHITATPTEDGLYIMTTKKGTGAQPQQMQTVKVHYTGKLLDGTVFDSSVERGEPFSFTLGAQQVIPGWEIALSKMHVGEKATVLIPSKLAYGERGNYSIPPFSPLVFEIELLGIEDGE